MSAPTPPPSIGARARRHRPDLRAGLAPLASPLGVLTLAALTAATLGVFVHAQAFIACVGVLAVLVLGVVWPAVALAGVSGHLAFIRDRAVEGEPVGVRLALRNAMPWTASGLRLTLGGTEAEAIPLPPLRGRRAVELALVFTPPRRGAYPAETPRIATDAPFGLWTATRRAAAPQPLIVWPRRFAVGPLPDDAPGRPGEGLALRDASGHSGEMIGTRPYRPGDPLKRVHWPQTARHGTLIVREHQATAGVEVQVVLDLDPAVHGGDSPEWAVRVAASFAAAWSAAGARVTLLAGGRAVADAAGSAAARQRRLLDALARVEPGPHASLDAQLALPAARRFRRGLRLVVTTTGRARVPDADASAGILTRAVTLDASGFGHDGAEPAAGPRPWLRVESPADLPRALLRTSDREARHAS